MVFVRFNAFSNLQRLVFLGALQDILGKRLPLALKSHLVRADKFAVFDLNLIPIEVVLNFVISLTGCILGLKLDQRVPKRRLLVIQALIQLIFHRFRYFTYLIDIKTNLVLFARNFRVLHLFQFAHSNFIQFIAILGFVYHTIYKTLIIIGV